MKHLLTKYFQLSILKIFEKYNIDVDDNAFRHNDILETKYADYQYNGLVRVFQKYKTKNTKIPNPTITDLFTELKTDIELIDKLSGDINVIEKMELSKSYVNITISNKYIYDKFLSLISLVNPKTFNDIITKKKIIVDYSSPNVAKSLHIGHLRSTIIGESIVRLLKYIGHNVIGHNHIGDWGTQFGMIINYLKNQYSQYSLDEIINQIEKQDLMEIYRSAKKSFDDDKSFADNSRKETYNLQQGDETNMKIWKKICQKSSNEYNDLYKLLNVKNLIERGESFYQKYIPNVLTQIKDKNLSIIQDGAVMIKLDHWSYPLILVKSDGGYTYDTTDLTAIYHRLCIEKVDEVIYITDSGQSSHFKMCFEIAEKMDWTNSKKLSHIGFGLVNGKDGKKIKTRSGEVVKMIDVIDEVIDKASTIMKEKLNNLTNEEQKIDIKDVSKKIGLNTLKYFDLSHSHESDYKYDPEIMFRFNGDTGMYTMYSRVRINGIIENSKYYKDIESKNHKIFDELKNYDVEKIGKLFTKETRDLILQLLIFNETIFNASTQMNTNILAKYLYGLCNLFNSYITQKDGKIINSNNELFGIFVCINVRHIIDIIFDILTLEYVDHC